MKKGDILMCVFLSIGILVMALQLPAAIAEEIPVTITGFSFSSDREHTRLLLNMQPPIPHYDVFKLDQPLRLVVDLPNSRLGLKLTDFRIDDGLIHRIRFGIHDAEKVRMVVDLKMPVQYLIFISEPSHNNHSSMVVELIAGGGARAQSMEKEKSPSAVPKKVNEKKTKKGEAAGGVEISKASAENLIRTPDAGPGHKVKHANETPKNYSEPGSSSGQGEQLPLLKKADLLSQETHAQHAQKEIDGQQYVLIQNLIKEGKYDKALNHLMRLTEDKTGMENSEFVLYAIAECLYQLGLPTGDWIRSIDAYQIAYVTFPDSKMASEALFRMGKAYTKMNLIHEANSNLRELVERFPDDENIPDVLHLMGANYIKALKFKEASTCFDQLVNRYPNYEKFKESIFNLGYSLEASGDLKKAGIVYEKALAKFPEVADLSEDVAYSIVRAYFKAKDGDEFKKIAFQVLNIFPDSPSRMDVMQKISNLYVQEGKSVQGIQTLMNTLYDANNDEAKQVLLFALADLWRRYPNTGIPLTALTEGNYLSQKDIDAECARVFSEKTGNEETIYKAGLIAMQKGDFPEAIRLFEKPLGFSQKGPFVDKLRNSLGEAISRFMDKSFREERYDDVVKLHLQKLKEDNTIPIKAAALFHIGESYRRLSLQEYSVPIFRKALELTPDAGLKVEIVSALGEIYYDQKKWRELIDLMMGAMPADHPKQNLGLRPLEILGEALFHVGHFDRAVRILEPISSKLSPNGKFCLARAYQKRGNLDEAERLYRQNIQFVHNNWKNDYASILNNCTTQLGDLFFQLGRFSDAKAEYQRLIEASSSNPSGLWSLHRMLLIALREKEEKKVEELLKKLSMNSDDSIWPSVASTMIKVDSVQTEARSTD